MENWIWAVWDDSEPDREDSEEEVTKSIPPTLLKYIFYRSTTVLNMTVTKVERAMKKIRWKSRRRSRTWSLRRIDFYLNTINGTEREKRKFEVTFLNWVELNIL